MKAHCYFPILLIFSILIVFSCKKKDDDGGDPAANCNIVKMTQDDSGDQEVFILKYDDRDRIQKVEYDNGAETVFTYGTNSIVVTDKDSTGATTNIAEVDLNSIGVVEKVENQDPNSSAIFSTQTYEYDANGLLTKDVFTPSGFSPVTTTYQSENGNITKSMSTFDTTTYSYYSDETFRQGSYFHILQLLEYGAFYINNKNVLKTSESGSYITNVTYETDGDNKITKIKVVAGGDIFEIEHEYQCE